MGDFGAKYLAMLAWAYAVLDHPAHGLFGGDRFVRRCSAADVHELEDLTQLHQWQLWLEERDFGWPSLEPELASRCRNALASNEGRPSRMQSDVVSALRALALPVREELVTAQG